MADIRVSVTPYEYTSEGIVALGKAVSMRHIKMAIFGTVLQFILALCLAIYVFPDKAIAIMIVSFYLGAYYSYYLLAKRRFNKKWGLIERLESESEEWIKKIHLHPEYIQKISPIIFKHIKLFTMNNYQSMKDLLIDQNIDTSDGKHFILTRSSIENDLLSGSTDLSHFDLSNAINSTAKKHVLDFKKESWTHLQPGAVNLIITEHSDELFSVLEEAVSKLIEASRLVCENYHISRSQEDTQNQNNDVHSNIVSLFSYQKNNTGKFSKTPEENIFIEITRIMGIIADIIEPVVDRYRLTAHDEEAERSLIKNAKQALEDLSEEVTSIHSKAKAIAGEAQTGKS